MKKTLILISALIGGLALPLAAFAETQTVRGCAVTPIPGTNGFQKADPACTFTGAAQDTGTGTPDAPGAFIVTSDGIKPRA